MPDPVATRNDWPSVPMPEERDRLDFDLRFSADEYERLCRGVIPREMESRWFAFFEAGWLYLHRSWTGYCVWQIKLEPSEAGFVAAEIWVNRNPQQQYRHEEDRQPEEQLRRVLRILFGIGDA